MVGSQMDPYAANTGIGHSVLSRTGIKIRLPSILVDKPVRKYFYSSLFIASLWEEAEDDDSAATRR
jgi:hypothetical protein